MICVLSPSLGYTAIAKKPRDKNICRLSALLCNMITPNALVSTAATIILLYVHVPSQAGQQISGFILWLYCSQHAVSYHMTATNDLMSSK